MKYTLIILTLILTFSCKAQRTEFKVSCYETREKSLEYPKEVGTITKTCKFENYIFKSTGKPNYKGQYSYEYELSLIDKVDTLKINNAEFFNENVKELEKMINDKLRTEYEANLKISEIKECMKWIDFRYYDINEFGISFNHKKQMNFYIDYDIGSACANVGGSIITLNYYELKKYLK